jgi:hypothetical protein
MSLIGRFLFYPVRDFAGTPADVGLAYEDVVFATTDAVRLHGWWVPGSRPATLVWFHGNAGNVSHRLDQLRLLHDEVGASVLLFDYRGYGRSEGRPTERGLYADARAALAWIRQRPASTTGRIVYFGSSLGAAVAVDLAVRAAPAGAILETPFTNTREMAASILPAALAWLVPARFDSHAKITALRCPLLFLHGSDDEIVPYAQGRRLYEIAVAPKSFVTIAGARHNDTYAVGGAEYFRHIREFLEGLDPRKAGQESPSG